MIKFHSLLLFLSIISILQSAGCKSSSESKIPLLIDADTANEVDDLYAIVRALADPGIELVGLTSAQFHISPLASANTVIESQSLNEQILTLSGFSNIPAVIGSNSPLKNEESPQVSEASEFIIRQAHKMPVGQKLNIAILGPCTNVASAILSDPSIVPKISVYYVGFWHDSISNRYDKKEFNSGNDTMAVEVLLNRAELDFTVMTATTSQHLVFEKLESAEKMKALGDLGELLIERWENYRRWWTEEDPDQLKWVMWDLALIEAISRPDLVQAEVLSAPPENGSRPITVFTQIDVDGMKEDFWSTIMNLLHH